jgi:tRNA(adenine34) deaminase
MNGKYNPFYPCPHVPFFVAEALSDDDWMKLAYNEALKAWEMGEVPVGAIIITADKQPLAMAYNEVETKKNPFGHCELLAMERAAMVSGDWRLTGCTLYVTKEPCPMCSGACVMARVGRVVFGAIDEKMGCLGGCGCDFSHYHGFNHSFSATGGILEDACGELLRSFFRLRR